MLDGWIKLHRKIRENPIFNDMQLFRLWIICLTEATHKERDQLVGKQLAHLMPGEFVTGRFSLNELYNSGLGKKESKPPTTTWRWLEILEKNDFVVIKSNNKYSVVSIPKWLDYQHIEDQSGQQVVNKWSTDGQQVVTNKNVKNEIPKRSSSPKSQKPIYDEESIPYRSANYLLTKIREFKPDLKQPNLQAWANDMRMMIEIDKREPKRIGIVIDWVTKDSFWKSNILSASKLREKWDALTAKMKTDADRDFRPTNKNPAQLQVITTTEDKERIEHVYRNRPEPIPSAINH